MPVAPTSTLDDIEQALLLVTRRLVLPKLHEHLTSMAGIPFDRASYVVLARIDEQAPVRPTDVARTLCVEPSTATRKIQHLEGRGFIVRGPDPTDGRVSLVSLSPEGQEALRRFRAARRRVLEAVLEPWDPSDRVRLASLLTRFAEDFVDYVESDRAGEEKTS
jgi:DNA-binding MarR family transcriptional regulator